jgi:Transcription antiterminator
MTKTITDPHSWFAIRCTSGREGKAIEAIEALAKKEALDLEAYMPAVTRWRRIRMSRKNVVREKFDRALFPGIVFIWAFPAHCGRISSEIEGVKFYTRRDAKGDNVVAVLPSAGIEAIRWLHIQGEFDETRPKGPEYTPAIGDKAYAEKGEWVGRIGEIVKIQAKHGTATLLIGKLRVKAELKTIRPAPVQEEEVAA